MYKEKEIKKEKSEHENKNKRENKNPERKPVGRKRIEKRKIR